MRIIAEDGIISGDNLFFVSRDLPCLFSINMSTKEINCIGVLYKENILLRQASRKIVKSGTDIVILPYNAGHVYVYNVIKKELSDIGFSEWLSNSYMYIEGFEFDRKVIMIGAFQKNIAELDLDTNTVIIRNTFFENLDNSRDMFCRSGFAIVDDNVYIALAASNMVMKIGLNTWDYISIEADDPMSRFSGIAYDGEKFWLSSRRGKKITVWDGDKSWVDFPIPFEADENKCNFGGIYYYNGKIWVHGFEGGQSVIIDPTKMTIDKIDSRRYVFFRNDLENGIVCQDRSGVFRVYSKNEDWHYVPDIPDQDYLNIKMKFKTKQIFGNVGIISENVEFGARELIELLKRSITDEE